AEAAGIAGAERHRLEPAGREVDIAEIAVAGIEQPQLAVVPARRMRHRETGQDRLAARNVEHHAAGAAMLAPAVGDIAPADEGDEGRLAVAHREAVEVAAVLGGEA